jgi:hypothetical protein
MLSCSAKNRIVQLAKKKLDKFVDCRHSVDLLHGMNGAYIQVTESFGVKFSNEDNMHHLFERQLEAYYAGLGPYCFHSFDYLDYTCYITETARTIVHCDDADENFGDSTLQRQAEKLRKLLRKRINFDFNDLHNANVGYIRHSMVCIDFGF